MNYQEPILIRRQPPSRSDILLKRVELFLLRFDAAPDPSEDLHETLGKITHALDIYDKSKVAEQEKYQ